MRLNTILAILAAGGSLAIIPVLGLTQGPTRERNRDGGQGFDAGRIFDFMARGRTAVPIAEIRFGREYIEAWARANGITSGQLTREQFVQYSNSPQAQQAQESLRSRFGRREGGNREGRDSQSSGDWRSRRGDPRGGSSQQGTENTSAVSGPNRDLNARADEFFRRSDRNGDGVLSFDEMSDTLKNERDKWDVNKDGVVDVNEFREYIKAWFERRRQEMEARPTTVPPVEQPRPTEQQPTPETPTTPVDPRLARYAELDRKVTVYRGGGQLPPNLPSWFRECDTNQDAQVSLYEWKVARRPIQEFDSYDLNGDGFIVVEELVRNPALALKTPESVLPAPRNLTSYRNKVGEVFYFKVTGALGGTVYGTGIYTDDSSLATAVVHAGLVAVGETAEVKVTIMPGQDSYRASTANGVTSLSYGRWQGSFRVERK